MKSAGWYFKHGARRVWAQTKAEISKLAQLVADETGRSVTVRPAVRMKRNPGNSDVRSPTRTEVRSPTRTSTKANTRGNVTVTGGAGDGATTVNLGPPARRTMRRNPDPMHFMDVWREAERARAARLGKNKRTKATRLAKGLRGADRGGRTKAAERQAQKTGKFAVHAKNRREEFTLYRPSRPAAESVASEFRAAGYTVTLREV